MFDVRAVKRGVKGICFSSKHDSIDVKIQRKEFLFKVLTRILKLHQ